MEVHVRAWSCLPVFAALVLLVASVDHIDVDEPIVRYSPANDTDQFGFAVTLHQLEDGQPALEKSRVIIGAPKGTFPGGLDYPDLGDNADNQTGLVYVCPLLPGSCEGLRGNISLYSDDDDNDFDIAEGRMFDHYPPSLMISTSGLVSELDVKTGQLMGSTLYSNGDNFIACAPRWSTTLGSEPEPRGRCYISDRSLTGFKKLWPCTSKNGDSITTAFERYCVAGTGVSIVRDPANPEDDTIVMGASGFNDLRGNLFYTTPSDFGFSFMEGQPLAVTSDGSLMDIVSINQGIQVESGFITKPKGPNAVADVMTSFIRYNGSTYTGRVNVFDLSNVTLILDVTAVGQQMAEFFGYSLLATDLTGDGYDELIVGAPMYSDVGEQLVELGRVYVFENLGGFLSEEPLILIGMVKRGRFGNSLVNLGDLNDDGYDDIAIGAPYGCENPSRTNPIGPCEGQNTGAVYIYYGSPNLTEFAKQTAFEIHSDTIVQSVDGLEALDSFGFSMASGVDVDGNQYNDLVIGAYLSKVAVILRSFPVATVNFTLPDIDPINFADSASKCTLNGQEHICFDFVIQATYSGRGLSGPLSVNYTVSEVLVSGTTRVFFEGMAVSASGTLDFSGANQVSNDTIKVYLENTAADVVSPLELRVEIPSEIPKPPVTTDGNQTATDLTPYPRLRQTGMGSQTVGLCGVDMVCQYDLELSISSIQYIDKIGGGEQEVPDGIIIGQTDVIRIQFDYSNIGPEPAPQVVFSSNLTGVAVEVIDLSSLPTQGCTVTGTVFSCSLGSVIASDETLVFTLDLSLMEDSNAVNLGKSFSLTFGLGSEDTSLSSAESNPVNNVQTSNFTLLGIRDIEVSLQFAPEDSVNYVGTGITVDEVTSTSDLGDTPTRLLFTIGNNGPTPVTNVSIQIYFPGKPVGENSSVYYLYPSRLIHDDIIKCDESAIDPDNLSADAAGKRRRSVMHPQMRSNRKLAFQRRNRRPRQANGGITVNCQENPEACIVITCDVTNLGTASSDAIELRVDGVIDERFYEDKTSTFVLRAFASSSISSDEVATDNNEAAATLTLTPLGMGPGDDDSGDDDEDLLHVILWPILGGLLVFVIIVLILYRIGFFRRKSRAKEEAEEVAAGGEAGTAEGEAAGGEAGTAEGKSAEAGQGDGEDGSPKVELSEL